MDLLFLRLDAIIVLTVDEAGFPMQWEAAGFCRAATKRLRLQSARIPWNQAEADLIADAEALEDELGRTGEGSSKGNRPGKGPARIGFRKAAPDSGIQSGRACGARFHSRPGCGWPHDSARAFSKSAFHSGQGQAGRAGSAGSFGRRGHSCL